MGQPTHWFSHNPDSSSTSRLSSGLIRGSGCKNSDMSHSDGNRAHSGYRESLSATFDMTIWDRDQIDSAAPRGFRLTHFLMLGKTSNQFWLMDLLATLSWSACPRNSSLTGTSAVWACQRSLYSSNNMNAFCRNIQSKDVCFLWQGPWITESSLSEFRRLSQFIHQVSKIGAAARSPSSTACSLSQDH